MNILKFFFIAYCILVNLSWRFHNHVHVFTVPVHHTLPLIKKFFILHSLFLVSLCTTNNYLNLNDFHMIVVLIGWFFPFMRTCQVLHRFIHLLIIFCRMMVRSLLLCPIKMERTFYVSCRRWRKPKNQLPIKTLVAWLWKLRNGLNWRRPMNCWKYWKINALSEWAFGSYKLFVWFFLFNMLFLSPYSKRKGRGALCSSMEFSLCAAYFHISL